MCKGHGSAIEIIDMRDGIADFRTFSKRGANQVFWGVCNSKPIRVIEGIMLTRIWLTHFLTAFHRSLNIVEGELLYCPSCLALPNWQLLFGTKKNGIRYGGLVCLMFNQQVHFQTQAKGNAMIKINWISTTLCIPRIYMRGWFLQILLNRMDTLQAHSLVIPNQLGPTREG